MNHSIATLWRTAIAAAGLLTAVGCAPRGQPAPEPQSEPVSEPQEQPAEKETAMKLEVTSPAFEHEGTIPAKYTCEGDDTSPALAWSAGPTGTAGYALIMDDPDAPVGDWVHWVVWNIPSTELPESAARSGQIGEGAVEGTTSWGRTGYGGPCPPSGTHRYYFKVYALDTTLSLPPSTTKASLLTAMQGHILAQGELMGRYAKRGG